MKRSLKARSGFLCFCVTVSLILMMWVVDVSLAGGPYTITGSVTPANGGIITPAIPLVVNEGSNVEFNVKANDGYYISKVTVNGSIVYTQPLPLSYTIEDNHPTIGYTYTIKGVYQDYTMVATLKPYHNIVSRVGTYGGEISPAGMVPASAGTVRSYTATPLPGYRIRDVTVNGDSWGSGASVEIPYIFGDYEIIVYFEPDTPRTHTITATASAGGSIKPPGMVEVQHGESKAFAVEALDGHVIKDIVVDGESVLPEPKKGQYTLITYTFPNVVDDHTIEAVFEPVYHTITVKAYEGGSVEPSGEVSVKSGDTKRFVATPDPGYVVVDIEVNGKSVFPEEEPIGTKYPFWVTATEGKFVEVFFKKLDSAPEEDTTGNTPYSGTTGCPVDTHNGELFFWENSDLYLGGPMPLYFQRYYASYLRRSFIIGELGDNWRHNFEWAVHWTGNNLTLVNHVGKVIRYTSDGAGNWTQQNNLEVPYQLLQNGSEIDVYDPETRLFYNFVAGGRLARIEDGKGDAHTLTYVDGKLDTVTDGLGRGLKFGYTTVGSLNKLTTVTERQNGISKRSVSFSYDATGDNLLQFINANLKYTVYTYAAPDGADRGLLIARTLPLGNTHYTQTYYTTANQFNSGKVKDQTDAYGNKHTLDYRGNDTTIIDPNNNTRVHTHTNTGQLTRFRDENGERVHMGYDASGRRSSITDRLGDSTTQTFDTTSGKLASTGHTDGTRTTYSYSSRVVNGFMLRDLTAINHPDGTSETFTYDASGNLIIYTDQNGRRWIHTYNHRGQVLTATNPLGGVTTYTYSADGTLASRTDPAGNVTMFGYDAMKRLTRVTHPDRTTREFAYDANDNLLTIRNERGNTTRFIYDANGNLVTMTDHLGNTSTFTYDGMDNVISVTDPLSNSLSNTYDALGRINTIVDRNGNATALGYSPRGDLASITDAGGNVWSSTHDAESIIASFTTPLSNQGTFVSDKMGRITQNTTPLGNTTILTYDSMGRVTALQNPLGETTTYSYDARGLRSDITLPEGISISYERNDLGLITSINDPNGNIWQRAYDALGRGTSTTDPLGNSTFYQYSNRSEISRIVFPGNSTLDMNYDSVGNITRGLYSDGTAFDYIYDAMNRLTSVEGVALGYDANGGIANSNGLVITRDAGGRISSIAGPITYIYDSRNLLSQVTDWLGGTTTFNYDTAGRLTGIIRPNGITTTYTYDADDNMTGITEGNISSISLTRDGKGQITAATRKVPLEATIASSTKTLTYDAASQVDSYIYDAMGRLINDGVRTYSWDLASRMMSYTEGRNTVSFTYDALGSRLTTTSGNDTRSYVWNYALGFPSIAIEEKNGSEYRYYVYTPGGKLIYSIGASDNSRRFYHYDEMGNALFLTDDSGTVIASYAYGPYGELLDSTGSVDNPFTWQGQFGVMQEGASGLYYMRARYYDSATRRFISRDPIMTFGPQSINPYQYALGNPLKYRDPLGLDTTAEHSHAVAEILEAAEFVVETLSMVGPTLGKAAGPILRGAGSLGNVIHTLWVAKQTLDTVYDSTKDYKWRIRQIEQMEWYKIYAEGDLSYEEQIPWYQYGPWKTDEKVNQRNAVRKFLRFKRLYEIGAKIQDESETKRFYTDDRWGEDNKMPPFEEAPIEYIEHAVELALEKVSPDFLTRKKF